jgi:enolase
MSDVICIDSYKLGTLSGLIENSKAVEKFEGKLKVMISSNDIETMEGCFADACIGLKIEYIQLRSISSIENATKVLRIEEILKEYSAAKKI